MLLPSVISLYFCSVFALYNFPLQKHSVQTAAVNLFPRHLQIFLRFSHFWQLSEKSGLSLQDKLPLKEFYGLHFFYNLCSTTCNLFTTFHLHSREKLSLVCLFELESRASVVIGFKLILFGNEKNTIFERW